jgi:hypothetical protein
MKTFIALALALLSNACLAASPYLSGDKVEAGTTDAVMSQVEKKLVAEGFTVVGRHRPEGLAKYGSIVVTDDSLLAAVRAVGGSAIVGAGVRVGVGADGSVSYMNPDYWYRAYFRSQFAAQEAAVKALQARLGKTLGNTGSFGGDVAAEDLPDYRYMLGMERIDSDKNELRTFGSFEEAVKVVRENLAAHVGTTAKVYEIVMEPRKIAVFGVAMNDAKEGEGWWVNKIGPDHIAALPYEIYIVDNKAYALFARYRIALSWPSLGMGQFMGIVSAPGAIKETLGKVAGVK